MEIKLKELLTEIDSRFSGPASCRLNDMLTGRLEFDSEEIEEYLEKIMNFGNNHNKVNDRKEAETYLNLFQEYIHERDIARLNKSLSYL